MLTRSLPRGWRGKSPPPEQALSPDEEEQPSPQESLAGLSRPAGAVDRKEAPARSRTQRSKRAAANGQGSGAPEQMAQDRTTLDGAQSEKEVATIGNPVPHHDEEAVRPAADAARPIGASDHADNAGSASVELTRCGWCGGTQFLAISKELGDILCECRSVYNPRHRCWSPDVEAMRQSPQASMPAEDSMTQDEIGRGPSEATASSIAGRHTGMDRQ